MYPPVGVNKTVNAEVSCIWLVAKVAAVHICFFAIIKGNFNRMVAVFPDAAAEEFVMLPEHVNIFLYTAGTVAHAVNVFTEEYGMRLFFVLYVFKALFG